MVLHGRSAVTRVEVAAADYGHPPYTVHHVKVSALPGRSGLAPPMVLGQVSENTLTDMVAEVAAGR